MRIDYSPNDANNAKIVCRQHSLCPYGQDNGVVFGCALVCGALMGILKNAFHSLRKVFAVNVYEIGESTLAKLQGRRGNFVNNILQLLNCKSVKSNCLFIKLPINQAGKQRGGVKILQTACGDVVFKPMTVGIAIFYLIQRNKLENKESCVA